MLKEPLIVQATKKNSWLTIDLQKYQIEVDSTGFIVALEWIITDIKYNYQYKYKIIGVHGEEEKVTFAQGVLLGITVSKNNNEIKLTKSNNKIILYRLLENDHIFYHSYMIRAEIENYE